MVGALEREIQVNIDAYKLQAANLTIGDIQRAISSENLTITGGNVPINGMKPTLSIKSEFQNPQEIENIVVTSQTGAKLFIKDFATVVDGFKEKESYSSSKGKNVITLNIIKRSGENLIDASDKIKELIKEMKKDEFPEGLDITVSGDQSQKTKTMLHDLINTIIIGFILVTIVLMFFMGVTNALFVALSVPLSMFVAFVFLPAGNLLIGTNITLNFMVLFALLFGLGIIVDDAIVVIENTHRIFVQGKGKLTATTSAKMAAGEVFIPVLAGTVTTLAPFFPLLFWPGIIGKFMVYLPAMLIFTLAASLVVAFIMNPVFAVDFMNHEAHDSTEPKSAIFKKKTFWIPIAFGLVLDLMGATFLGNFLIFFMLLYIWSCLGEE